MSAKILVATSSKTRARQLAKALRYLNRGVDILVGDDEPIASNNRYRLLVCELGPRLADYQRIVEHISEQAFVLLAVPDVAVELLPQLMQDPRVNHVLRRPAAVEDVQRIADKLATGTIFGLDRYLPPQCDVNYRRVVTFDDRCSVVEELLEFAQRKRLRSAIRRAAGQAAEELLMNAMYQAPVEDGHRVFGDVEPSQRVRRRTPRPVSLRYGVSDERQLYLSVRDRYGSLHRDDLVRYLHRCTTEQVQIERKKLGAGLGLFLIASTVSRLVINLLPGAVTEIICMFEQPSSDRPGGLCEFSFTAQRPLIPLTADTGEYIEVKR
ncbi:MAG: hypothetical protein H6707_16895 [Deltaproteobacteria bacterium]|nr:hypothetical protein [Deltaproteobacteria bacterium]